MARSPGRRSLPGLAASLILSGCVATQQDMLQLSQQTDTLAVRISELRKTMNSLQANQAELATKLDLMHRGVSTLNESLKDNQEGMSRLSGKLDDLGAAIGTKVSSLDQTVAQQRRMIDAQEEARRKLASDIESKQKEDEARRQEDERKRREDEARKAAEAAGPAPSSVYHSARVQLSQGKHDLAAQGFELYLQRFPKGEVADLATYYLGQARFAQQKWEEAARQFALVLDRHPKSDLTPSARLMYASALLKLGGHAEEAGRYLESIPEDFPDSPEAKKAKELLKSPAKPVKTPPKR